MKIYIKGFVAVAMVAFCLMATIHYIDWYFEQKYTQIDLGDDTCAAEDSYEGIVARLNARQSLTKESFVQI